MLTNIAPLFVYATTAVADVPVPIYRVSATPPYPHFTPHFLCFLQFHVGLSRTTHSRLPMDLSPSVYIACAVLFILTRSINHSRHVFMLVSLGKPVETHKPESFWQSDSFFNWLSRLWFCHVQRQFLVILIWHCHAQAKTAFNTQRLVPDSTCYNL